jgi:hypothetical protein
VSGRDIAAILLQPKELGYESEYPWMLAYGESETCTLPLKGDEGMADVLENLVFENRPHPGSFEGIRCERETRIKAPNAAARLASQDGQIPLCLQLRVSNLSEPQASHRSLAKPASATPQSR